MKQFFGFFLLLVLISCDREEVKPIQNFNSASKRWDALEIKNYDFTYQKICFCRVDYTGPFNISVVDGKVFSVNGDTSLSARPMYIPTMDSLFLIVEQSLNGEYDSLSVKYDDIFGYPKSFYVDKSRSMADEEFGFSVSNFQKK